MTCLVCDLLDERCLRLLSNRAKCIHISEQKVAQLPIHFPVSTNVSCLVVALYSRGQPRSNCDHFKIHARCARSSVQRIRLCAQQSLIRILLLQRFRRKTARDYCSNPWVAIHCNFAAASNFT